MTVQLRDHQQERLAEGRQVVRRVAKRMRRRLGKVIPLDDLEALGLEALAKALPSYDPTRGSFAEFVGASAKWAMLTGFRSDMYVRAAGPRARLLAAADRSSREHEQAAAGRKLLDEDEQRASLASLLDEQAAILAAGVVGLDEELQLASTVLTPEERAMQTEADRLLADAIQRLPDRERALVERHYFGDERFEGIAKDLGISAGYASKLHDRALLALGRALKRSA